MLDLFTTKFNYKLPMCLLLQRVRLSTYTLNISGEDLDGYVFCRVALIPGLIQSRISMTAPGWPGLSWFLDLVDMSKTSHLPLQRNLLTYPFCKKVYNNLVCLYFYARHLDSVIKIQEDSQKKWYTILRILDCNCRWFGFEK